MFRAEWRRVSVVMSLCCLGVVAGGCRQDMHDQPKYEPLEQSTIFADGAASRPMVEGTVARGMLREDPILYTGRTADDLFVTELPVELSRELLDRGQARFNAFCSPCHGRTGEGNGMVVQRGFKHPQSLHETRLRESPLGYYFHVMTNGFGEMSSYAAQVSPEDRWAIAAYIRALQLSQFAPVESLSPDEIGQIENPTESAADAPAEAH